MTLVREPWPWAPLLTQLTAQVTPDETENEFLWRVSELRMKGHPELSWTDGVELSRARCGREGQGKHGRREQKEEAREVAPEVPGDLVPNDRFCRSETIKLKRAICQQLGTGSARTDRIVPRKAWKFCPGRKVGHKHKGTASMVESQQRKSK